MKLTFLVIVFVSLIGMITPAVAKNGTIGIYAIVDHVTFEPSASAPDMVRRQTAGRRNPGTTCGHLW